jgi:hypothetical protein
MPQTSATRTNVERINIHEPDDIRRWAKRLEVDEDQLKETIKGVGTSVNAVKKALATRALRKG